MVACVHKTIEDAVAKVNQPALFDAYNAQRVSRHRSSSPPSRAASSPPRGGRTPPRSVFLRRFLCFAV
jgi:hypothetical protein